MSGERIYIWCSEEVYELYYKLLRDWKRRVRRGELQASGRPSHAEFLRYLLQLYVEKHGTTRIIGWK